MVSRLARVYRPEQHRGSASSAAAGPQGQIVHPVPRLMDVHPLPRSDGGGRCSVPRPGRRPARRAVGETILPHPPLHAVGVSIGMKRGVCGRMTVSPAARLGVGQYHADWPRIEAEWYMRAGELLRRRVRCGVSAGGRGESLLPGLKLNMPPWLFCMSWCPDFEFRGGISGDSRADHRRGELPVARHD